VRPAATAALLLVLVAGPATAHEPAVPPLGFEPPAPGTYTLHRIMAAPDGEVLDLDGRARRLADVIRGRLTLLSLVYTTCIDPEGCPHTLPVFDAVRRAAEDRPRLRERLQLVTLSFDPERDTPAAMRGYAGARATPRPGGVPWHFLTTRSTAAVAPLLDGFGQDVRTTVAREAGGPQREISHVLKVFLIDRSGSVREIYGTAFLHPRLILNDLETLLDVR
jgi:cytochrome c peroxidase/protein SCO1/2